MFKNLLNIELRLHRRGFCEQQRHFYCKSFKCGIDTSKLRAMGSFSKRTHVRENGRFPFTKNFRKLPWKGHRVKSVFHLTQVPFVYALVTKIQDGGTLISL